MAAIRACLRPTRPAMRGPIVIAQHPIGPPALGQRRLVFLDQFADRAGMPWRAEQGEIERQMDPAQVAPVIRHEPFDRQIDFADKETLAEFVDHVAHLRDQLGHFRAVGGVEGKQRVVRRSPRDEERIGRIVPETGRPDQVPQDVDAEPVDPAPQPEPHRLIDCLPHLRIAPVQIRLLLEKGVVIVLPGAGIEFPGAATEF
jgi:hypothetical protein